MNLITSNIKTMNSEELADLLQLRHDNVRQSAINLQSHGVITFTETVVKGNGRPKQVLQFDERNSIIIAAKLNDKLLAAVVDRWQELESAAQSTAVSLPSNYIEALQALIESEKDKAAVQEQLQIAAPKIEFHDTVVNSSNTFSTRDAAKKINQRPIKLGEWLKGSGYLCLNGRAAQKYIDQGLFVTHTGVSDNDHSYMQTRMTSKGCAYFANKLFEIKL